jgi:hypothetical protein
MKHYLSVMVLFATLLLLQAGVLKAEDKLIDIGDVEINITSEDHTLINSGGPVWFQGSLELGFIDVIAHTIQFGTTGSEFNYVGEGGQNILFPFKRISGEIHFGPRHALIALIQPLTVETEALLTRDVVIDDLVFPENTPMRFTYGFDFYRLSYQYDLIRARDKEFAIGLSLQLRNASIRFQSLDGTLFRVNQDVGPVPIFRVRTRFPLNEQVWWGTEIDGFYASGRYITGSNDDFEGAILDGSCRLGFTMSKTIDAFINLRYLGGGARGTNEDDAGPGDGYTNNWLHTVSVTLGVYAH